MRENYVAPFPVVCGIDDCEEKFYMRHEWVKHCKKVHRDFYDEWLNKSKATLVCDKNKEPPCHLTPSKELCEKCELNSRKEIEGKKE